ncbi:MAG: YdeI/OmpD-associated family protein [Bacteroidales bacterium]
MKTKLKPVFFKDQQEFRKWLEENHDKADELHAGFYKTATGKPSMTWPESVDQALCFGWIDGIRNSVDKESYCIRFTPRRPNSTWSAVNLKKMDELLAKGLVTEQGIDIYNKRKKEKTGEYSYENRPASLPEQYLDVLKKEKAAYDFYLKETPSYRRMLTWWILSARQEKTRLARLEKAIMLSKEGKRIY